MYQGLLIFGIFAVILVVAAVAVFNSRRTREESLAPEDQLTDEQFRKIEFGDDD